MPKITFVSFAVVLFATNPALSQSDCGGCVPCFSNVADILNGQTYLLKEDDFVFGGNINATPNSGFGSAGAVFPTSLSMLSSISYLHEPGTNLTSNTIAECARMFDSGLAVAFTAFASNGPDSFGVFVDMPWVVSGRIVSESAFRLLGFLKKFQPPPRRSYIQLPETTPAAETNGL